MGCAIHVVDAADTVSFHISIGIGSPTRQFAHNWREAALTCPQKVMKVWEAQGGWGVGGGDSAVGGAAC